MSIGLAGVTFAIVNFSVAIQTVISQVILRQQISPEQLVGVFVCILGACCVALSEQVLCILVWCRGFFSCQQQNTTSSPANTSTHSEFQPSASSC